MLSANAASLTAFLLALVRASAWIVIAPPFSSRAIPVRVKASLAFALAIVTVPSIVDMVPAFTAAELIPALLRQLFAGAVLGILTAVLFAAVQAAGSLIDVFSGLAMSQLFDPMTNAATTVFGRFYELLAITLLFVTGGHLLLVKGFVTSFQAAPLSTDKLASVVMLDMKTFGLATLELAGPIIAVLFITDIALGLLTKAAPQLNVFQVGIAIKIGITLMLGGVALVLLPDAVTSLLGRIVRQTVRLAGG